MLVIVLGFLTALGSFTIDLYLPALPVLQQEFAVSAALIQLTLTATTVGFGLGQLLVGPWSDRVGRRVPLVIATVVHVAASIGVALSPTIETLFGFRVLQGMGAAAGAIVAMAIVRDLFGGRPLVRMLSRLALINGLAPILAPVIGAQFMELMPWRGMFVFLAIYGALAMLSVLVLIPETLPIERRSAAGPRAVLANYRILATDRVFVAVSITGGLVTAGLFAYVSSSTFLLQDAYGMSPQEFSLVFAVNAVGLFLGVQLGAVLARRWGPQWVLVLALSAMVLSAAAVFTFSSLDMGIASFLVPLWFYMAAGGACGPSINVLAMDRHGARAGTAASVLGAMTYLIVGLVIPVPGVLGLETAGPMAFVMLASAVFAVALVAALLRPRSIGNLTD